MCPPPLDQGEAKKNARALYIGLVPVFLEVILAHNDLYIFEFEGIMDYIYYTIINVL